MKTIQDIQLQEIALNQTKKSILITGCSPSIKDFIFPNIPIFGVNDSEQYIPANYLIIVNEVPTFANRWDSIKNTNCPYVYSHLDLPIKDPIRLIKIKLGNSQELNLDKEEIDFSVDSPFMACILAYKLGYNNIFLIGCDYNGHRLEKRMETINSRYEQLKNELLKRNVNIYNLSKKSLITTIPKINYETFSKYLIE